MRVEPARRRSFSGDWRPTVATIDLEAIRHNVRTLRPHRAEMMAVVKANGYGHGDVPVALAALEAGATWLGVALVEEGLRLREAGIRAPILALTEFPPDSERDALDAGITPCVYSMDGLRRLADAAARTQSGGVGGSNGRAVHVKLDTGMHRVGHPFAEAEGFVRHVLASGLRVGGVWTHFAKSEEPDDAFTSLQLRRFGVAVRGLRAAGIDTGMLHAANSAAVMSRPDSQFDMVRVGIAMYGLSPGYRLDAAGAGLRPAMTWASSVAFAKRVGAGESLSYGLRYRLERASNVATVPVGYADGYSRQLSNRADVLIGGRRHRVAGSVSMDQLMVDCQDEHVEAGDQVMLIGRQGDQRVTAEELASLIETIPYEVVCGVGDRVTREYVGDRVTSGDSVARAGRTKGRPA